MKRTPLTALLERIDIYEPVQAERLQVFPLRWAGLVRTLEYETLDQALEAGTLEVSEISEGGSVPTLRVINRSANRVFLLAGEQLVGAKQNRVLNADILVPAEAEIEIPVSCVEQGRWAYKSRNFASAGSVSHGTLRKKMSKQAFDGYRTEGKPSSRQGEVWAEVESKLEKMKSQNASAALDEAYQNHQETLSDILAEVAVPAGTTGVAFAIGGRVVGLDIFDRPETLARLLPKLVKSYALDALEDGPEDTADQTAVRGWLEHVGQSPVEQFESPGLGHDLRFEIEEAVGAGLLVEDHPLHLEVFA